MTPKVTKPLPLNFRTDVRALRSLNKQEPHPKEEIPQIFKAKDAPDFSKLFFTLKPASLRKSIDFSEFSFLTAKRAEKRNDFENVLKERKFFQDKRQMYIKISYEFR